MKVGVIGRGFGSRVVAPLFAATDGCEVLDVVSARDAAAVAALCHREDLDLVAVHSPPFLHLDHVRLATEAGHAVLCDKPFGRNVDDAEAMCSLVDEAGVVGLVNFQFRYGNARVRLRELVGSGAIGTPEHVQSSIMLAITRTPLRAFGWLFDAALGGGWLGAGGSHSIDFFRWLVGDVDEVRASTWTAIEERPDEHGHLQRCTAEDSFSALLRSESGVTGAFDSSFAASVNLPSTVSVFGSEGVLVLEGEGSLSLERAQGERATFDFTADDRNQAFQRWAEVVRDALRDGKAPLGAASFEDGLACARILQAMRDGS
jgi:predicted dehydrogenase